jgi:regulatory protein
VRRRRPDFRPSTSPASAGEVVQRAGEGNPDPRTVRTAALALLAGRDFSRHELTGRLLRKGYDAAVVETVVQGLVDDCLLQESRYVEQFVGQHARKGQGPARIRHELRERGVDRETVDAALAAGEVDWVQRAREARRRKFGAALPLDRRERAKQARFLQYRGFSPDQIRAALGPGDDDPDHDQSAEDRPA